MKKYITNLEKFVLPAENEIRIICNKAKEIFIREDNVLYLVPPISIVGDLHGQYDDFLYSLSHSDKPPSANLLFLGDYVDRGDSSVELFIYLLLLKILHPTKIHLLRGNHETAGLNMIYGFYDECLSKYNSPNVFYYITDIFNLLPICAVVNEVFCVHGGLSPNLYIDDIDLLNRDQEIPSEGIICDLMWSDPEEQNNDFEISSRGCGYTFGEGAVDKFNELNAITRIYRAHQLCHDGYRFQFNDKVCTVWSAPNYCGRGGNFASICELNENMEEYFNIFSECPNKSKKDNHDAPKYFL